LRNIAAVSVIALCVLAGPALGQAPPDDPEATVVSELVVRAVTPGPAWWKASDADSTVWIFGLPAGSTPTKLAWDRSVAQRRMVGANALLMPPFASVSITASGRQAASALAGMTPGLRWTSGNVEAKMTPDLAERFAAARTKMKRSVGRYASPVPALAGIRLGEDYLAWAGLQGEPGDELTKLARKTKTPLRRPPTIQAASLTLNEASLDDPGVRGCFEAMIDDVEVDPARHRAAAAGWAVGDVRVALNVPRDGFSRCENQIRNTGFARKSLEAQTAAIVEALEQPGKTVAAVPLRLLVADDGVIERLRARGVAVVDPTGLEDG